MGKTPIRNSRQPIHRNNPYSNNCYDASLIPPSPYVVLQRFDSHQAESCGSGRRNARNDCYNRQDDFKNPFPRYQQNHAPISPFSHHRGGRGSANFYGKFPSRQFKPQPPRQYEGFHQPGRDDGWHQHPSPFASQRPPFNQQQWGPPTRNVRGRRQQTPMKRGTANMTLSVATSSQATSKTAHPVLKTTKVKASASCTSATEWKRSPIKLRKSLATNPIEKDMKIITTKSALEVDKEMKSKKAEPKEEDLPLSDRKKFLVNKRKSIEASVKRLSVPRNQRNATLSVADSAKEPQEEKLERRKSVVTKRKSMETNSTNKFSVHNIATDMNAVGSNKKIKEKLSKEKLVSVTSKRKSLDTASTKRLSMPRNAVLKTAVQGNKLESTTEHKKLLLTKRRSLEVASIKRLSMPRNAVLSVATKGKNEVKSKPPINKRKTLDSETIKKLSVPIQSSRRLSTTLNKRKSLTNAAVVQKVELAKKKATPVEASRKALKKQINGDTQKIEKPKTVHERSFKRNTRASMAADCVSPMYYTPETSPATRSLSCPRSPTLFNKNVKQQNQPTRKTSQAATNDLMTRLNTRRSVSRSRISDNALSQKSDRAIKLSSNEKNVKSKVSRLSLKGRTIQTRSQSRTRSVEKEQGLDMKRKRSVSEAPSSPPTPKKTKTTPTSKSTPSATKKSGSLYTPSRRQILGTPQSTVGTPRTRKSQPTTPRLNNRAAQMVQAVLNQQQEKQSSVPLVLPTDVWRIGHSIAVQTVDPTDVLSDYDRLNQCDDSSSDEEEGIPAKDKFVKQVDGFKQSLKGSCVVM